MYQYFHHLHKSNKPLKEEFFTTELPPLHCGAAGEPHLAVLVSPYLGITDPAPCSRASEGNARWPPCLVRCHLDGVPGSCLGCVPPCHGGHEGVIQNIIMLSLLLLQGKQQKAPGTREAKSATQAQT